MRHVPDGVLRRLDDEPLAVPDRAAEHVADCARCRTRRAQIADDADRSAKLFSAPRVMPDIDIAWNRMQRDLHRAPEPDPERPAVSAPRRATSPRFPRVSMRAGLVLAAIGILVVGTAAAATFTTIFAPTHVAPVSVSQSDVRAIAALIGLDGSHALGGFPTPDGSTTARFGTIAWSSSRAAHPVSSRAQAATEAGFPVSLPTHLPAGVGAVQQFVVQPRVRAVVTFDSAAASLDRSSVTVDAGPAVLAQYGGTSGNDVPTLGVAAMPRPTALSKGASISQIESFLLAQPGIPPALAEEIRLLGDLRTILPVPVPTGALVRSVRVAGWPGVLLTDSSNAAAGVVWEDGKGMLHVVAGLLAPQDVLNVASQIG